MWSGIEPDALRRAANTIALYGMRVPVEERVAIIGALWDQAVENEEQDASEPDVMIRATAYGARDVFARARRLLRGEEE